MENNPCCKPTTEHVAGFPGFSEDLVRLVFEHLNIEEIQTYVEPVCEEWKNIAYDPHLWKEINIQKPVSKQEVKNIFQRATLLQKLTVCEGFDLRYLKYVSAPELLKHLTIVHKKLTVEQIAELVERFPNLESLDLSNTAGAESELKKLCTLKKLKTLSTFGVDVSEESILALAKNCQQLESIYLYSISDSNLTSVCKHLSKKVKGVTVKKATDSTFCLLSVCSELLSFLAYIAVGMSDKSLQCMMNWKKIKYLWIGNGNTLTSAGLTDFFNSSAVTNLRVITLFSTLITDAAVKAIATRCRYIRSLILIDCGLLTDESLESIVMNLRFLENLCIMNNSNIEAWCLEKLDERLEVLPELKSLDLTGCGKIDDNILRNLKNQRSYIMIRGERVL